ncbi:MAG TPA: type II secretion system F family protein [Acidimicrobiia bacterium]|jgi:tight adherence protein B
MSVGAATVGLLGAFVGSKASAVLIAVLAGVAVAAAVAVIAIVVSKRQRRLERTLAGYDRIGQTKGGDLVDFSTDNKMVAGAVEMTRDIAERAGVLLKVEHMLEQADLPLRAPEALFYLPVLTLAIGAVSFLLFGALTALVIMVVVAALPFAYVRQRQSRRLSAFDAQLPDTLNLLAGSMRAGFSFMQGLEAVANEAPDPMGRELQRSFSEARLGRDIDYALEECAERMENKDLQWVVLALRIQREVGGNLAELLDTVAATMTQRERLRREVKSLTAEGRFSAVVLSIMPFFFLAAFQVLQPNYVPELFKETIGIVLLIGSGIGVVVGWFWLRKIVNIEV